MKRNDVIILLLLFALWLAWPAIDRRVIKPLFFPRPPAADLPVPRETPPEPPALAPRAEFVEEEVISEPSGPEQRVVLQDDKVRLTFSSRGAGLVGAELLRYPLTADPQSEPVRFDFSRRPALVYRELPGFSAQDEFRVEEATDRRIVFVRAASGLTLRRTVTLEPHYGILVSDSFEHSGSGAVTLPAHALQAGEMPLLPGEAELRGILTHGVDTLKSGEGVRYWGAKLSAWFDEAARQQQLRRPPIEIERPINLALEWAAVKNRYFAQIIMPEGGMESLVVGARRRVSEAEQANPDRRVKQIVVESVWAFLRLDELIVPAGEAITRVTRCYLGPKKYDELAPHGRRFVDVMEFGFWAPVGKVLLLTLNALHRFLWPHNYGLAIILLTVIIRVAFWPLTHKSTESMRKMQEIQPLIQEIRKKYKDNAQRQQQELMALYKEHRVNPLAGCLPILVQIPVMVALFVVLRSAIELRFARFLWIRDLSQPENLLQGMLPFGLSLNILPIIMAITMAWQQRLTPSGGDPQQQKMLVFMPAIMLAFFYNLASGLVLYWTTNQCLMIGQQLVAQWRRKAGAARRQGGRGHAG